jgi:hypothetical protein
MRWLGAALLLGASGVLLSGCTLTAAEQEENRQVAIAVGALDPSDYGAADIDCADVPWLGSDLAERSIRCWRMPLGDGQTRAAAVSIADDLAAASGGVNNGEVCGTVEPGEGPLAEVQCASFASMPEARDANVEIWVALSDDAVAQLEPGTTAGEYFVTFRLVAYGPEHFQLEHFQPEDVQPEGD